MWLEMDGQNRSLPEHLHQPEFQEELGSGDASRVRTSYLVSSARLLVTY